MTPADLRADLLPRIAAADLGAVEAIRVEALGRQGSVSAFLKTLGRMSPDERQTAAPAIQALREDVSSALATRKSALEAEQLTARLQSERIDLSLPASAAPVGRVHPISQVFDELTEIFADLGFSVATGPEIEDQWHNFSALNIPETHPARAMHDTFYLDEDTPEPRVLRTHTSPVQIRAMMSGPPPHRLIAPGRVYRSDSDATHTPMFHQVEGLVIDRGITMGHLKWTLQTVLAAFFERDYLRLRLRPSYFPFTEPSAEVDVGFTLVDGQRVIGGDPDGPGGGWMELLGSGMVHHSVLAACDLDADEWQGFAFGVGVDRLAMLKYGIEDLRACFDGDQRWLAHYGFSALAQPTLSGGVGA